MTRAFVAHSFSKRDRSVVSDFESLLTAIGMYCYDAEDPEPEHVSDKVQKLIKTANIFVGIFTRDRRLGRNRYTASPWIIQETGYAISRKLPLILLVENGVDRIGGLQGDYELVRFDRRKLHMAFLKVVQYAKPLIHRAEPLITSELNPLQKEVLKKEPDVWSREGLESVLTPTKVFFLVTGEGVGAQLFDRYCAYLIAKRLGDLGDLRQPLIVTDHYWHQIGSSFPYVDTVVIGGPEANTFAKELRVERSYGTMTCSLLIETGRKILCVWGRDAKETIRLTRRLLRGNLISRFVYRGRMS